MDKESGNVILVHKEDPEILGAYQNARSTFKYFWREMHWESRRIVPGVGLAAVKFAFSDSDEVVENDDPTVEHMWISEVEFDGQNVTGVLINKPNWLKSVKEGDQAKFPIGLLEDWMYVIGNRVYGGYTISVTRSRMSAAQRKQHDSAWGLDFGEPGKVRLVYFGKEAPKEEKAKGLFGMFNKKQPEPELLEETPDADHPASIAVLPAMMEALKKEPAQLHSTDERGWTVLHYECLGGSAATVEGLLKLGADPLVKGFHGETPLDLARCLGWSKVEELLQAATRK